MDEAVVNNARALCARIRSTFKEEFDRLKAEYPPFSKIPALKDLTERMEACAQMIDPRRKQTMVMLGLSCSGKTSLTVALAKQLGIEIDLAELFQEGMLKRTESVRVHDMESFDMIDTVGFAGKKNDKAKEKLETEIKRNKPDVLIVVTSAMNLAREHDAQMLEKSIVDVKKMIYSIWKFHIPIVFVFHRIDELFVPQGDWEQYCHSLDNNANLMPTVQEMLSSNLPSFKADKNKFLCITATRWQHHYGIQRLIDMVTANTDIQNIIPQNSERFYRHYRRTTAARIISAFSGFNSVVGGLPLPGVDILITNRMIDIMLNLLALLAVNANRTAKTYRAVYETAFGLISLGRYVMLALAKGFEFTGVGIPIGIAVGATAGGGTTALVGWQAYEYFTEEKINAPE